MSYCRDGDLERIQKRYPDVKWNTKAPLIEQIAQLAKLVHTRNVTIKKREENGN